MNILFIAIDAGKDSTKFVFNNQINIEKEYLKLKYKSINFGVDITGTNSYIVEFEGKKYLVGDMVSDSKLSFNISKKSIEHKISIYLAISKVLEKIQSLKIKIAIGAPLSIYKNDSLKEEYRRYILNNGFVNMKVNGKNIRFALADVLILPESIVNLLKCE